MSYNQSRAEKSDAQLKKPGRSGNSSSGNYQRGFSGGGGGRGGGINAHPGPPAFSSSSSAAVGSNPNSLSANRSFKKTGNGQGGQYRVNPNPTTTTAEVVASAPAPSNRGIQNGAYSQTSVHATSEISSQSDAKPVDASTSRTSRPMKPPPSQTAIGVSDANKPVIPAKGGASPFTLQFGSISPGFVNGMPIPARTSSAPPNLDEQKHEQAHHGTLKTVPTLPIATSSIQQQQQQQQQHKEVMIDSNQANMAPHHAKKDPHTPISVRPTATSQRSSGIPLPGKPVFEQSQGSIQFGLPGAQMQSQAGMAGPLQIPMVPLSVGNPQQGQQQMYFPGLQPPMMPTQGLIHQGHPMPIAQIGHQLPQMNLGMRISSQYPQQQVGNFAGTGNRKAVKITHPQTHEEVRLDKKTDLNQSSHSQPVATFPTHQINYFPPVQLQTSTYGAGPVYYPLQMTGSQTAISQAPRYNYSINQGGSVVSIINPSTANSLPGRKSGSVVHGTPNSSNLVQSQDIQLLPVSAPSGVVHLSVKPEKAGTYSSEVASPVHKEESIKKHVETFSSLQQKAILSSLEDSSQERWLVLEPSDTSKGPIIDSNHTAISSMASLGSIQTDVPSSIIADLVVGDGFLSSSMEMKRKDSNKKTDSFEDRQRKRSGKDIEHPQQQHQGGTYECGRDSDYMEVQKEVSSGIAPAQLSENLVFPQVDSSPSRSSSSFKFPVIEHDSSHEVRPSQSKDARVLPASAKYPATSVDSGGKKGAEVIPSASVVPDTTKPSELAETCKPENTGAVLRDNCDDQLAEPFQESKSTGKEDQGDVESLEKEVVGKAADPRKKLKNSEREAALADPEVNRKMVKKVMTGISVESTFSESDISLSLSPQKAKISSPELYADQQGSTVGHDTVSIDSNRLPSENDVSSALDVSSTSPKLEEDVSDVSVVAPFLGSSTISKDQPLVEINRMKTAGKKMKRKDIISKADAAGTNSDLYMAYKGPEEKVETGIDSESFVSSSMVDAMHALSSNAKIEDKAKEVDLQSKVEPDDWEDAAEIATPSLRRSESSKQVSGSKKLDRSASACKKYSRDFLLTFSKHYIDLPSGFEISSDVAGPLMDSQVSMSNLDPKLFSNSARIIDRPSSSGRADHRTFGASDEDKWTKASNAFASGRDLSTDVHGQAGSGFRPGSGVNPGVLRNPRAQSNQYSGGILSGPMQSPHGGMTRGNFDADRWQRSTGIQRGLIPSPQAPSHVMHKAEKKYEVGKVSDVEEAKQRQLKAILNKLTPQNFDRLFDQVKQVNIDNAATLRGVISQIFDKALMEPTFCEMYANFCLHLSGALPDFVEDNDKITFKRLLLNKCQEEFEKGEKEEAEANKVEEEGEMKQTDAEREQKKLKARRRMLGNIRLIGEVYKKKMLTERIMHECIQKLLSQSQCQNPDEESIEALCKLMSTIGEMIDHFRSKEYMDAYFDSISSLSNNQKLSSRLRFMLKDAIDLRKNSWQQRRKVEGPKKIDEVHRDAVQERQAQASRLTRGPGISSSGRRVQPAEYGPRGSTFSPSPGSHMPTVRSVPSQTRGLTGQDVRLEDRHPSEARTLSVPLPQRPPNDDSITLGPQGSLARGMSMRGQPLMPTPSADISSTTGGHRKVMSGPKGYTSLADRPINQSEEVIPKHSTDKFMVTNRFNVEGSSTNSMNTESRSIGVFDRSVASTPLRSQNSSPEAYPLSEDCLRKKSISTIREYYSAKDEKEVTLCIEELKSPNFYPLMISSWVTDSFERKDVERDLLSKLLINLFKVQTISLVQLIQGFELVLSTLEDAVNDAPKAAEFLGRMFARIVSENVISLKELGRLIHEGGEEPGDLIKAGLAADVIGSILENIKIEKGDSVVREIISGSSIQLEDFRPPQPLKSKKLDAFIE